MNASSPSARRHEHPCAFRSRRSFFAIFAGGASLAALAACAATPEANESAGVEPQGSLEEQCGAVIGNPCTCPPGETLHCTHYNSVGGCTQFQCEPGPPPPPPPPPCGILYNACCPGSICNSTASTCVNGTCESCGSPGQIECANTPYPCPGGVPANGVCVACSGVSDTNVAAAPNGPTQATVSWNASAGYTSDVALISTTDLSDMHTAVGSVSVQVAGLNPATEYWVTVGAGDYGDYCYQGPTFGESMGMITQDTVQLVRTVSGFDQSSLAVDPSSLAACPGSNCAPKIVFQPSAALAKQVPSLAKLSFPAPTRTIVTPSPLPNIQWWMDQLTATTDENSVVVTLGPNDVDFQLTASGHISFSGSGIGGGLAIDPSTIDVHIGLNATTQTFVVNSVKANIQQHVTSCVADPWLILLDPTLAAAVFCGDLVESQLPDLNTMVQNAILGTPASPGLQAIIGTPQVSLQAGKAFATVVDSLPFNQPLAAFLPGTMSYGQNASIGAPALTFGLGFVTNAQTTVTTRAQ
jgi:hypothetical protein